MGAATKIEWCHHTFNPWHGCENVSPGCAHCYAEAFSIRLGQKIWGHDAPRRFFGDKHWNEPRAWNESARKAGERRRVFCASMADIAEARVDLIAPRNRLHRLIDDTEWLDWMLLTKRPENVLAQMPETWKRNPPANVWWGATVENNTFAWRVFWLLRIPARVRFISAEPLLEKTDLLLDRKHCLTCGQSAIGLCLNDGHKVARVGDMIHMVIDGGESGNKARPYDLQWARDHREQCRRAGVAFFMKQGGDNAYDSSVDPQRRLAFEAPKGGDLDELPEDLQIREFPSVVAVLPPATPAQGRLM
jgi:protein gp37